MAINPSESVLYYLAIDSTKHSTNSLKQINLKSLKVNTIIDDGYKNGIDPTSPNIVIPFSKMNLIGPTTNLIYCHNEPSLMILSNRSVIYELNLVNQIAIPIISLSEIIKTQTYNQMFAENTDIFNVKIDGFTLAKELDILYIAVSNRNYAYIFQYVKHIQRLTLVHKIIFKSQMNDNNQIKLHITPDDSQLIIMDNVKGDIREELRFQPQTIFINRIPWFKNHDRVFHINSPAMGSEIHDSNAMDRKTPSSTYMVVDENLKETYIFDRWGHHLETLLEGRTNPQTTFIYHSKNSAVSKLLGLTTHTLLSIGVNKKKMMIVNKVNLKFSKTNLNQNPSQHQSYGTPLAAWNIINSIDVNIKNGKGIQTDFTCLINRNVPNLAHVTGKNLKSSMSPTNNHHILEIECPTLDTFYNFAYENMVSITQYNVTRRIQTDQQSNLAASYNFKYNHINGYSLL